jgi:GDP-L-fucose synthase
MEQIKKILITGGSGMVGRNFLEHDLAKKYEVLAPNSTQLNLTNFQSTLSFLHNTRPDLVVHAAGKVGGIQANIAKPVEFLEQNVSIGRNIIMASYSAGIKSFINLASTCMYPKHATNPLSEDKILTGSLEPTNEGYALAKIMATRLCQYIKHENLDAQYKTIIPCNLFGRFDKFEPASSHLIPAIIHKIFMAKANGDSSVEIWGDGNARREFMYAANLADALYKAIENLSLLPSVMNCGVGYDHSINEFYRIVADVIGWGGEFVHDLAKPSGMEQKLCDTRLQKNWGWAPSTSLRDGIQQTYQFYLEEIQK